MMIQRLLLSAALLLSGNATFAQFYAPDYRFNIGIYGGLAPTTKVYRTFDQGINDKSLPNIFGVIGHYNINSHLQVGLNINTASEWSANSPTQIQGSNGQPLGQQSVRFVYAERTWTTEARVNGLVPVYDRLKDVRSNFYYGAGIGAIFTINDGGQKYTQVLDQVGEEYRFVSEYRYAPAAGYTLGVQLGMEWYIFDRLGVNVEFAPRFNHLNTVDNRASGRNGPFDLITFPTTIGIRYRFGQ